MPGRNSQVAADIADHLDQLEPEPPLVIEPLITAPRKVAHTGVGPTDEDQESPWAAPVCECQFEDCRCWRPGQPPSDDVPDETGEHV